ncbi:hypothetical protein [Salinirubrum litoreum]|uniref:Uncharacterized protein n=1 Tax=Salinirubrum litoreum TaxID=1126234 RepID=A0ABD5RA33_9EURY|nr:hypothetical protein [Salinirubrum litoreum]
MFDWLFPNWSNPAGIALLLGVRLGCNVALTALVARRLGRRHRRTVAMAAGTLASTVITVLVLRPGGLGLAASRVEFVLQLTLLAVAGYTVAREPRGVRGVLPALGVGLVATFLTLVMVVVYGEALVAP